MRKKKMRKVRDRTRVEVKEIMKELGMERK